MAQIKILFIQYNKTIRLPAGTLLSEACRQAGLPMDLLCGGGGICGKCRVLLQQQDRLESVLACQTRVMEDLTVVMPEGKLEKPENQFLTEGDGSREKGRRLFVPALRKKSIHKADLKRSLASSTVEAVEQIITQDDVSAIHFKLPWRQMKQLDEMISNPETEKFTLILNRGKVMGVQEGDTTSRLYGAAVDIGTTSLVMYLYDLTRGEQVGVYSGKNPQSAWGADVISRILHAEVDKEGTRELQLAVIRGINSMIEEAAEAFPEIRRDLWQLVMGGNSAMHHLLFGFSTKELGQKPFRTLCRHQTETSGKELGLCAPEQTRVIFLPLLGGFVGADITAVLLSVKEDYRQRLIIDLGTNGEIALGSGTKYRVASTACGPALEGAGLTCGMRAAAGAIERVDMKKGQVKVGVIGGGKASGICGSGVVDLVAELLRQGVLEASGRMLDRDSFVHQNPYSPLAERLVTIGDGNAFMIAFPEESHREEGVYLTQKDLRQIQMATSAIYTGCFMLMEKAGISQEDLDEILLAGAFGNYIHIGNAQQIGMIPCFEGVAARSVGNAAGTGLQQVLLDCREEKRGKELAKQVLHMELAEEPSFQEQFMKHLEFGMRK